MEKAVANGPHTETRRDAQCGAHLANQEKDEVCEMAACEAPKVSQYHVFILKLRHLASPRRT